MPAWLGRIFAAGGKPEQQGDKSAWVRTGQVYARLALQMTALGIKSAFPNQPIAVAALRRQFGSAWARPQRNRNFCCASATPPTCRAPCTGRWSK